MTIQYLIVLLVAMQRLAELMYARRNTKALRQAGAVEHGAEHYPLFVLLHGAWLLVLLIQPMRSLSVPLLAVFLALQAIRVWVVASLGQRWTTRVLVLPGQPLVRRGPYRYVRHPNYLVVVGEIAVLPLAFGFWEMAALFSVLNGLLLARRIRIEDRALVAAASNVEGRG